MPGIRQSADGQYLPPPGGVQYARQLDQYDIDAGCHWAGWLAATRLRGAGAAALPHYQRVFRLVLLYGHDLTVWYEDEPLGIHYGRVYEVSYGQIAEMMRATWPETYGDETTEDLEALARRCMRWLYGIRGSKLDMGCEHPLLLVAEANRGSEGRHPNRYVLMPAPGVAQRPAPWDAVPQPVSDRTGHDDAPISLRPAGAIGEPCLETIISEYEASHSIGAGTSYHVLDTDRHRAAELCEDLIAQGWTWPQIRAGVAESSRTWAASHADDGKWAKRLPAVLSSKSRTGREDKTLGIAACLARIGQHPWPELAQAGWRVRRASDGQSWEWSYDDPQRPYWSSDDVDGLDAAIPDTEGLTREQAWQRLGAHVWSTPEIMRYVEIHAGEARRKASETQQGASRMTAVRRGCETYDRVEDPIALAREMLATGERIPTELYVEVYRRGPVPAWLSDAFNHTT